MGRRSLAPSHKQTNKPSHASFKANIFTHTHTHTNTHTHSHTHTLTHTHTHTHSHTHTHTHTHVRKAKMMDLLDSRQFVSLLKKKRKQQRGKTMSGPFKQNNSEL